MISRDEGAVTASDNSPEPMPAGGPAPVRRANWLAKLGGRCRRNRRGTAVVEFALVAPVFILLVFGMIEYGRMVMVQQILTNASREGARRAVLDGVSTADAKAAVNTYMTGAGITGQTVTITTAAAVAPDYAQSMTVQVTIPFSQVSWLPSPMFLGSHTLKASTTMRCETVQ